VIEVHFLAEAIAELEAAEEFYESRLEGLGIRFLLAVQIQLERIVVFPDSGQGLEDGIQKVIVLGFPFSIIYRSAEDQVLVAGVEVGHVDAAFFLREGRPLTDVALGRPVGQAQQDRGIRVAVKNGVEEPSEGGGGVSGFSGGAAFEFS